jgi:hypothetical protein
VQKHKLSKNVHLGKDPSAGHDFANRPYRINVYDDDDDDDDSH